MVEGEPQETPCPAQHAPRATIERGGGQERMEEINSDVNQRGQVDLRWYKPWDALTGRKKNGERRNKGRNRKLKTWGKWP